MENLLSNFNFKKGLALFFCFLVLFSFIGAIIHKVSWLIFWIVIIASAIVAYQVLPRIK